MKIFIPKINEAWVVDKFRKEFIKNYPKLVVSNPNKADIIWILAPWLFHKLRIEKFKSKKIICSFYHIDQTKQDSYDLNLLQSIDPFIDQYHTISKKSMIDLKFHTKNKIVQLPFWVNSNDFYFLENKEKLKKQFNVKKEDYIVGSFQRDSEGYDLNQPKLIKGPDIFLEIVKKLNNDINNLHIVLTGKRRNYLISNLNNLKIKYSYFEMVSTKTLNRLYNILDLYIVSSRLEGGPQAILECATSKTPVISTKVGVAEQILNPISLFDSSKPESFFNAKVDIEYAKNSVKKYETPLGIENFKYMLEEFYES